MQAFYIIRSILGEICPVDDIIYIDNKTTFAIYHARNKNKVICRFESSKNKTNKLAICYPEIKKYNLESIDDIYSLSKELKESLESILNKKQE